MAHNGDDRRINVDWWHIRYQLLGPPNHYDKRGNKEKLLGTTRKQKNVDTLPVLLKRTRRNIMYAATGSHFKKRKSLVSDDVVPSSPGIILRKNAAPKKVL
jgi:hypothetical protein